MFYKRPRPLVLIIIAFIYFRHFFKERYINNDKKIDHNYAVAVSSYRVRNTFFSVNDTYNQIKLSTLFC